LIFLCNSEVAQVAYANELSPSISQRFLASAAKSAKSFSPLSHDSSNIDSSATSGSEIFIY
jgi:hypothetical protein